MLVDDRAITPFAETNYRNQRRRFGIQLDDRRRHVYLIGKTGMGKSVLLENLLLSDIEDGHGVALIDPHGDFVEKMLDYIPKSRVNDVVYFNPADTGYPVGFNVFEVKDEAQKHLVASGLVGVFKKIYAESWGPRLEYVLRNTILALLDYEGSTLLGIMRLLVDKAYRKKVVAQIQDPVVRSFWVDEYARWNEKFQTEAISPIQNKVGQFLANSLIRNIVGQVKSSMNMREIMDNRKILLVNLAKGRIGEDTSALLGAMIITKLQLAAMERVDIPEAERKDFFLYVDEFQNFATDSFAGILSEARKYRLNLTVAHQYIEQLSEQVAAAVFGNVGTIICFRVGGQDAEFLEKEFAPQFEIEDLVNLPKWSIYLKLMINGVASEPFSAGTLPPHATGETTGVRDTVIRVSRERYARPKELIQEKIARWTGMVPEGAEATGVVREPRAGHDAHRDTDRDHGQDSPQLTRITCDLCAKEETVPFVPDPNKPIYCKNCLKKVKSDRQKKSNGKVSRSGEGRGAAPGKEAKRNVRKQGPAKQQADPVVIIPAVQPEISLASIKSREQ